jgi:hypothetical protein
MRANKASRGSTAGVGPRCGDRNSWTSAKMFMMNPMLKPVNESRLQTLILSYPAHEATKGINQKGKEIAQ